jgi:hypothetical protein
MDISRVVARGCAVVFTSPIVVDFDGSFAQQVLDLQDLPFFL